MLSHWVDCEYEIDVRHYRGLFAAVDRSDPASLRSWFDAHTYLRSNDIARIACVSLQTVRRWRRAAGLPPARRVRPANRPPARQALAAPADWRIGDWLADQYPTNSIRDIARAIGRSYTATRRHLRRRGVQFSSARDAIRSRHPCCRLGWLFGMYVGKGASLARTARAAGVSMATMTEWLLSFRLRVRSNSEQQYVNQALAAGMSVEERMRRRPRVRKKSPRTDERN